MKRLFACFVLLLCSACIQLGSEPVSTSYYLLNGLPATAEPLSTDKITVSISLDYFPTYLERREIVTHDTDGRVIIAKHDAWAEPLQDNFLRVLRNNLSHLLPQAQINLQPWEKSPDDAIHLNVLINDFSGRLNERARLDISWTITAPQQEAKQRFQEEIDVAPGYLPLVTGLDRGLDNFSLAVAQHMLTQK
ncbi:MAG: hypothetical protein C0622_14965 [Desulfuromonas sp.]|nr:MAG: hypothetical protein C0622_14965 [Desulfuromonas sp.]